MNVLTAKKRSCLFAKYLVKWKNYIRFTWEPASAIEDTVALDEFEANLNERGGNVMG